MENQIREFTKKGNRRRLLKRVVSLLCVVVLLFTMNTLKRNANTLERIAMCGIQEHIHTAGCYNSSGELVCAIQEHIHTDACYQQSPSDDLLLNGGDLENAGDLVDVGDTQDLDLSLDLDQGDLLDFVQDSGDRASDIQDGGNDMLALDGDLVHDVPYNNEETQYQDVSASVEKKQSVIEEPIDEIPSGEGQALPEEALIAIEDDQEQPVEEETEQSATEEAQEQPAEEETEQSATEEEQEQPVEEETEQSATEEEQEQPVEEETEQSTEEAQEQPAEEETEQSATEEEQEQSAEEETEQSATEEVEEQPAEEETEQSATEEVEEQPDEEETEQSTEEAQEQPVEEETEQSTTEEAEEQPAVEEQEETSVEETEQSAEEAEAQPVVEVQEESVVEEAKQSAEVMEERPAEEAQEQPVAEGEGEAAVEEAEQPAEEEQEQPAEEAEEQPTEEAEEQPTEEEKEQPVAEEEEGAVVEEAEQPAKEAEEQPAEEPQEQPAVEEQEAPVEEEAKQPAEEAEQQPTEEAEEQPTEEKQEQPTEEKQEQPTEEKQEQPTEEAEEQPTEEKQEQPTEETQKQSAEEAQEQPTEVTQEQPAEEAEEQSAEEAEEQPAEEAQEQPAEEAEEQPAEEAEEQPAEEAQEQPAEEAEEQPAEEAEEQPAEEAEEQPAEEEQDQPTEVESEEEPEAQIAYPAQQFRQGTAYINVSVDAPEGAFPEGTVMVVRDVEDQGTIDNIQQSVSEDFVEVTSVHAVDISFWYNDAEIEPLLPIAVVMSAVEAPNEDHETVVVHVDDNGKTQLVDSEATGAAEAVLEMPAAADAEAQAFEADTFSVYALVTKQIIETKYIDDHGDTWRIKVDYGKDAKLPEGASLQVAEVTDETYLAQAEAALESGKRITKARFFDIKIMDGDREVQPDDQVKVTVTLEGDEGEIEATENQNDIGNPDVVAMHFVEQDDETVSVEKQSAVETDEGVVFNADGFSAWGVIYTVDFEVEGNLGVVAMDFTGFDATQVPEEGTIYYSTEDCNVHMALGLVRDYINNQTEVGYDVDVDAALVDNYEFDFDKVEMGKANGDVRFENGELIIASDGFVELVDGERFLRVDISNLTALKQALLATEGASIKVIEGSVPLGSEASYTAHTDEETAELVENYINNEENGDVAVAGYSAADLKIVRNEQTLPVEGQFKVTVDKASLVPEGMKLEKLYHIHRNENDEAVVEELAFEETEAGLVFEVGNFSDIVASYTVDFEYNGYKWSFPGLGSYSIASIMEEIGVEGEITHVSLKLVEGEEVEGALYLEEKEDGWYLTSDVAFDETYELTVVVDGKTYVITVTDDQKLTQINVTFKNINGSVDRDARLDGIYYVAFNKWMIDKNCAWASPIDLQDGVANIYVGQNIDMTDKDGNNVQNSGDLYIDSSNVQIYKFSGEKTDLEKSIAAYTANGKIENGASIGKYVLTRGTSINGGVYEFTFEEQPAYDIDVYFKDADGNPSIPSDKYFVFASVNKEYTNNGVSTTGVYHTVQGPLSFDNNGHASVFITQFKRNNANPASYSYPDCDDITVYLVKNQDNNFVGNNENDRGTITAGEVVTNGSMVGGYSFTVTSQEGKTTFVGQIPQTMNYTVKVVDANGVDKGSAPDLNNKQWFIQATVNRDDGSYIATARIDNAFSGDTATGSFNALHRKAGTSSLSTAYRTGEDVSFALLRAKDGGDHNWEYFADTSHINTNAMSGSSVESKYTLHVDQEHHVLTLQEAPAASIVLTAHSGMETTDALAAPILDRTQSGKYYIAGEMFVQDGTVSYNGYALEQYNTASATQTMAVTEGLKAYTDENKWQAEYVTGKRFIDPILVYVSNSANLNDADAIRNAIKDKNSSVEIYRDGEAVEGYKLVVEKQAQLGDETDATVAKMHLVKLPTLTVTGVWDGAVDSANDYYTLTELKRGEVTAYALTPFSTSETGINCFEDASGNKVYYQDGDTIDNYMVKVAKGTSLTLAQAIAKSAGTRYAAGQMMGGYTPAFAVEDTAITTTLKPVSTTGSAHNVSVKLYDKDNVALSAANPTIGGDYYVLAYLTAKGDPNKQVVAWTVNQVGMGSDQVDWPNGVETHTIIDGLNTKGVYAYTIPASTGFKALDSDLKNTGDTLGFDPALYDLNLRMYTNGYYNVQDIDALTYSGIRENFDDSAPSGYDYVTPEIGANVSTIKLRQAYEKEYRLRVDVDELGLEIKDSDKYIVRVKLVHHSNNQVSYAFAKLVVDKENKSTYLDFYGEEKNGKFYYWRDGNCAIQENIYITGNEKATQLDVILLANPIENSALGNLKNEPLSSNDGSVIPVGESINMYSLSFGKRETVDEHQPGTQTYKTIITDVIKFNVDNGDISKGDIDSYLETATNFGLYTENLSVHGTDMESNIGAHELTGQIGADYGFSGNNVQVNRVKVVKKYEGASAGTSVTLKLYPVVSENDDGSYVLGEGISQTVNTNGEGIAVFEYKGLISGTYVLKEVVGNKEYGYDDGENGFVNVDSSNLVIDFNEKELVIKNINVNVNYFGSIAGDVDVSAVIGHSRHGVIVTDDQNSYDRLLHANGNVNDGTLGSVYKAGSEQHPTKYNIPADMDSLRVLSQRLGTAVSSRTVRIINKKLSELNSAEYLNLNDDGRYIVVNVDVTGEGSTVGFNPMTKINGVTLRADFGQEGSEYASRVLYNFITRDAHGNVHPYTGHIDTTKEGSGVLLAPSAVVGNLAANWGGTIICHEAQHTGSEIHSDSANKIQNINTVLTNRTSDAKKGNLELQKNIFGESMDHTTWFTFEVTMCKANGDPAANETFVASGLRDKDATSVTFDENGVLRVQVRAQNKVLITGIPEGYTYTVKEIRTVETAHYQLVQLVDAAGEVYDENTATYQTSVGGTIAENTTDVVQAINAHKVGGLTVGKTVVGDETREKKFTFRVTLYNAQGEVDTAINRYYGGMSFVNGVAEFQLGNGEFKTAKEIPTGTKFTVEEISANSDGFVTSVNVTALVPAEQEDKTPSVDTASSVVSGEIIEDSEGNKIAIITAYKNTHYEGTMYTPKVTKRLVTGSGAEADDALWPADGFTFTITPAQNNPEGVSPTENFGTAKATVASKTAVFGALTFVYNESDVWIGNRTYTYTIAEVIPDDAVNTDGVKYSEATEEQKATGVWKLNGITYSAKPVNLTVEVGPQDDGDNATLLEIKRATYKYSDGTVISDGILNPTGPQVTVDAAEGVAENLYTKPTGALTITKQVTVDGNLTSTQLADGTYSFAITGPNNYSETRSITITNGVADSIELEDLEVGTYTITETVTDGHATLSARSITGTGSESGDNAIELTVTKDSTASNTIAVFTNNVDTGVNTEHNLVTVNKTDGTNALSGATFALYSDANCTAGNEVKIFAMGDATSFTINTNDDDLASRLPDGTEPVTLYLKETVAPANHRLDNTVYPVTLTHSVSGPTWDATAGKYITTTTYGITVNNKSSETVPNTPLGSIEVTKLVKVDNVDSTELLNKTINIGLFKGNEPANDATPIQTATLTVTGASTTATLFTDLEMGTYYVYELDGSSHPVKNGGMVTLSGTVYTVTEQTPNVTLATAGQKGAVTVTNSRTTEVTHDHITVTKVDPDNNPVAGATFTLYAEDKETEVKTFTTTEAENGNVFTVETNDTELAGYLPAENGGTTTLYLKETVVPANYKGDANEYLVVITRTVTVTDSKTTTAYAITIDGEKTKEIINTPLGELEITKNITVNGQSSDRTGTFWYAVYRPEDLENGVPKHGEDGKLLQPAKDADGKPLVGSIDVTENGANTVKVPNLYYGDYYVFELNGDPTGGTVQIIPNDTNAVIGGTVYHVTGSGTTAITVGETVGSATLTNNVSETTIIGKKTWVPFTGGEDALMNPVNTTLTLTLYRYIDRGNGDYTGEEIIDTVEIKAGADGNITRPGGTIVGKPDLTTAEGRAAYAQAWSYTWEDKPLYGGDPVVKYAYKVTETVDNDNFYRKKDENSDYLPNAGTQTQVFTNFEKSPVALPATGGMGTGVVYGAGAALVLLAVLGMILTKRKRTDGEGIR